MSVSFYIGSLITLLFIFGLLFTLGYKHFKKEEDYENKKSK